jgi:hypothetical protein
MAPTGRHRASRRRCSPCAGRTASARSARPALAPSTAYRILVRHGVAPLAACDRATGEPVRRYERSCPGDLVHIDVKKPAAPPNGGRIQGSRACRRPR